MMNLFKLSLCLVILLIHRNAFPSPLKVDEVEVKRHGKVRFQNYRGRVTRADKPSAIRSIGRQLARGSSKKNYYSYNKKYSIRHIRTNSGEKKFSADIFTIERAAKVKHITYVRLILSSYLSARYGYSERNARTLAVYLTYYNAVYRGDMKYFKKKYAAPVTRHLTARNAGISTRYSRWPGRTRIVIPLTSDPDQKKIVDPDEISGDKVTEKMKADKKTKDDRKDLVKIKKKIIEKEKRNNRLDAKILEKKRENLEEKKKDLDKKESELKEIKRQGGDEKEIQRKEREVATGRKEVKKEEVQIEREEFKRSERKEITEKKERDLDNDNATTGRETSQTTDNNKEITATKEEERNVIDNKLYYLKVRQYQQNGHYDNDLYMINATSGKVEFRSELEGICGNKYDTSEQGVIVISHIGGHEKTHHLTLVHRQTLKRTKRGKENIFWRSFVETRGGSIYAVVIDSGEYFLGKFNMSLKMVARSTEKIENDTFLSVYSDKIYINRADGEIMVLNKADLSLFRVITK